MPVALSRFIARRQFICTDAPVIRCIPDDRSDTYAPRTSTFPARVSTMLARPHCSTI
jgi:hypothetical protein